MNSIKHILVKTLIFFTVISGIDFAQNITTSSIIGNWESVNSENNRVQVIKFDYDSTFYFQSVLSAEYSYSVIGNKMIAKLLHSNKTIIDTTDIIIKKDTLISIFRRNGTDEITTMVKIPGVSSDSIGIVGDYLWKYPIGTEGGLSPLYQYASTLSKTRFTSSAFLGCDGDYHTR